MRLVSCVLRAVYGLSAGVDPSPQQQIQGTKMTQCSQTLNIGRLSGNRRTVPRPEQTRAGQKGGSFNETETAETAAEVGGAPLPVVAAASSVGEAPRVP